MFVREVVSDLNRLLEGSVFVTVLKTSADEQSMIGDRGAIGGKHREAEAGTSKEQSECFDVGVLRVRFDPTYRRLGASDERGETTLTKVSGEACLLKEPCSCAHRITSSLIA
jgi:hypothetical protein